MKISSINYYSPSFQHLYISTKDMKDEVQTGVVDLARTLYFRTDFVSVLNKKGVDIFVYTNKENPKKAKVAFADKQGNVYKLRNGKYSENTESNQSIADISESQPRVWISNSLPILDLADKILRGKINEKSANNDTAKEIKELFKIKDFETVFRFPPIDENKIKYKGRRNKNESI